jgi:hypothetical protein
MNRRRRVLVVGAGLSFVMACVSLEACASNESSTVEPEEASTDIPASDAGTPEDGDAADGGACSADDCAFFPDACAPDALCMSGLFDPVDPNAGLDWRTRIASIGGRSATDAWLVGTVGTAARFDGESWKPSDVGTFESLRFVWPTSEGELAFGALGRVYSRGLGSADGGVSPDGWTLRGAVAPPPGYGSNITAVWAGLPGSNVLWLATSGDVWRLDSSASTFTSRAGIPASVCNTVPCKWLRSLHGASAGTIWGVGDNGAAVRITGADGETPELVVTNPLTWNRLNGVWAASDTEAWAVGGDGTIIHNTGAFTWEAVPDVPTTEHLNAVAGSSSSDIWAAGNAGVVLHFDGTAWSRVKIAGLGSRRPDLYTAWSPGPGRIWIGGQGVLLAFGDKR